jgi:oligoendopeptidase F
MTIEARAYFDRLNQEYLDVAMPKERWFWTNYMGTTSDHAAFAAAETAYKAFATNPERIKELRAQIEAVERLPASGERDDLLHGLRGWLRFFEVNAIENPEARAMEADLVRDDAELFGKRKAFSLHYVNERGEKVEASTLVLSTNLVSASEEDVRKSSHDALLGLERWVVENGFIPMIRRRNAFARAQGYRNYFDYKVRLTEGMSPEALFAILDEFERDTRPALERSLAQIAAEHGERALAAHNFRYYTRGDTARQLDPYLPFALSLRRWVESFGRMAVDYREAELTLDLLDRKGKYENGFMHLPRPPWYRDGVWVPAAINFTSNANPAQVGSGEQGLLTLFHEGGHAAHFANVAQNAPCFSQEFPPTSMAYAETQSMFFDSLMRDADWMVRYARNRRAEAVPEDLIRQKITTEQALAAYQERSILVVPYFEWAIYSLADEDLSGERLVALARATEQKILGIECSPRPLLAIPHLLNRESACSYHGYLLAHMAVYQTRAWFERELGYIVDNPEVGPLLAEHYWRPGNSVRHGDTLVALTGEPFTGRYLAEHCNRSPEQAWDDARRAIAAAAQRPVPPVRPLNASIRVVHGAETIADNRESDAAMLAAFESWIDRQVN